MSEYIYKMLKQLFGNKLFLIPIVSLNIIGFNYYTEIVEMN